MHNAYKLLEELMALLAVERNQILNYVKTGTISPDATSAVALAEANNALKTIAKIKRIEAMLDDVKSLMQS